MWFSVLDGTRVTGVQLIRLPQEQFPLAEKVPLRQQHNSVSIEARLYVGWGYSISEVVAGNAVFAKEE